MEKRLFTSESVTEGHPDKICDQISDAILDELMKQDPMSRVACETSITTGLVLVMGEITTKGYVDIQKIVRETIREIGYDRAKYGFDCDTCGVITALDEQSTDIAMGVDKALEAKENKMSDEELDAIGAGDQGMMFGYATNETEEFMPYPIALAHKLALKLTEVRKNGTLDYLRPDGKTQVTVEYDEDGKPVRLDAVVLSTQHDAEVSQEQIHKDIKKYVFDPVLPKDMVDESYFRMPDIPTPESTGVAPIFNKYVTYNKRKDTFSNTKNTFDSYRNFLNFFLLIHLFKDEYMTELGLIPVKVADNNDIRDDNSTTIEESENSIPKVEADIVTEVPSDELTSNSVDNTFITVDESILTELSDSDKNNNEANPPLSN